MTILSIVPHLPNAECHKSAMESLELAVERVQSGETVTVGIVEIAADGGTYTHWSKPKSVHALLGAIERLKHKIMLEMDKA